MIVDTMRICNVLYSSFACTCAALFSIHTDIDNKLRVYMLVASHSDIFPCGHSCQRSIATDLRTDKQMPQYITNEKQRGHARPTQVCLFIAAL